MARDKLPPNVQDDLFSRILQGHEPSPLPFLQEVPSVSQTSDAFRAALEKRWIFNSDGDAWDSLAIDESVSVPLIERNLWSQPFAARSSVEPVLAIGTADADVKFAEIDIELDDVASIYDHALKQYVQKDNQAVGIVQGKAAESSTAEVSKAIDEAEASAWTEELRSGNLPVTYAPGMNICLFGSKPQAVLDTPAASQAEEISKNGPLEVQTGGNQFKLGDILSGLWVVEDGDVEQEDLKEAEENHGVGHPHEKPPATHHEHLVDDLHTDNDNHHADNEPAGVSDELDDLPSCRPPASTSSALATSSGKQKSKSKNKGTEWAVTNSIENLDEAFMEIRGSMAMHFPFELDTFQKEAICNLEMGRSVFVAAHTSAGKTVVAEYAFALATKHCTRAVYTSPIKTISNQKFRDFSGSFEVGLMTGDVQIRPNAPCLIMTTEILRSMLYKGADLIRDMEFVIFDEVHYVNDADRGVVWEETIIMLPPHCSIVLLSATVPNVKDFAGWVGRTKRKEVHVSATHKRPVPLEHSLFYGSKLYPICKNDKFTMEGLHSARADLEKKNKLAPTEAQGRGGRGRGASARSRGRNGGRDSFGGGRNSQQMGGGRGRGRGKRSNVNRSLLQLLKKSELLPSVIFAFSKKWCDNSGRELAQMDLTTSKEKHEIHVFCEKALSRLNETDRQLPQIIRIKDMLKRGIAVHHAGLLPIVKEIVEMLFCRGLVQVLFATETFAMGVNAPARAVVFNSLEKHDGQEFRMLLAGEYTQMSGRAGRRGLDKVGTVIICCSDELPEENDLRRLLQGKGLKLTSRFRLTYSMILNLMRVEDLKVEDMLKRSFAEHHAQKAQPDNLAQMEKAENAIKALQNKEWPTGYNMCSRSEMEKYHKQTMTVKEINERNNKQLLSTLHHGKKIQDAIRVGQTVLACDTSSGLLAAGVICGIPVQNQSKGGAGQILSRKVCLLSLHVKGPWEKDAHQAADESLGKGPAALFRGAMVGKNANGWGPLPQYGKKAGSAFRLAEVDLSSIVQVYKEKLSIDAADIVQNSESQSLAPAIKKLRELETKIGKDRVSTIEAKMNELALEMRKRDDYIKNILSMPCHRYAFSIEGYASIHTEHTLEERLSALRHNMSDATLKQMPEFENRVRVLEYLGYIDETGTVKLKGRVACEINSGDEVVTTEMIFCGFLTELDAEEAVALVSAFVFQEKTADKISLTPRLDEACHELRRLCMECARAQADHGIDIDPEQFCDETLNFGLVEVVYHWAKGTPFKEICSLTSIMEGSIVRTIVRLEQACREIMDAARVMGNTSLFVKMQQASGLIKRDVIFAASLYVS